MADINEHISKLFPEASFETSADGREMIVIPDAKWHDLAATLQQDQALAYDYLVSIVGMDWGEKLGCYYYLASTKYNTVISVKVEATGTRQAPYLHSVADLWTIAQIFEREVYDFFGIRFIGNPDMRRLFLSIDWKGYPLRKDYNEDNPISIESERQSDFTDQYYETADGKIEKREVRIFQPEDFVVNIGPQHPATHGVLRFRTAVDGETIKKIDVYMGYIHRGVEKLCETLTYAQQLHFLDRLDYFSGHIYHHCMCNCVEKAAGIEISERAKTIRVLMDELSRIASHCLFMGTFCMDLGATTMLFYTLRVREMILDIMDKTCGARMSFNYECIGGVMMDLAPDFEEDVRALLAVIPQNLKEYNKIFTGNVIAKNRMEGVGVLSRADAIDWAITGPSGRASDWACDVRKVHPYSLYPTLEFDEVVRTEGDSMARFKVRLDEITQSARIIEQLLDRGIPEGEYCVKVPKVLKLPVGHWYEQVEGCRGAFGVFIESDGETKPYRVHLQTPCVALAAVVDKLTEGEKIADLITIGGSLDYIVPDMDR